MRLKVVATYGEVSFQDEGRVGYLRHGVPNAGPFDRFAAECARVLAGSGWPVLEVGGSLSAVCEEPGSLAWAGPGSLSVGGRQVSPGRTTVRAGQRVEAYGAPRLYLAAPGGWEAEHALGSVAGERTELLVSQPSGAMTEIVSVTGIHDRLHAARVVCLEPGWNPGTATVVTRTSRAGVRLEGSDPVTLAERQSVPIAPGCLQLAPGGELLVIGPDGPVTGGYPLVGWLCPCDLDRVAQWRAGDPVSLSVVSEEEAVRADLEEQGSRRRALAMLAAGARRP